jgi:hypothetical protein
VPSLPLLHRVRVSRWPVANQLFISWHCGWCSSGGELGRMREMIEERLGVEKPAHLVSIDCQKFSTEQSCLYFHSQVPRRSSLSVIQNCSLSSHLSILAVSIVGFGSSSIYFLLHFYLGKSRTPAIIPPRRLQSGSRCFHAAARL